MKYFGHDAMAHDSNKLTNLICTHGMEGYGFYWFVNELICQDLNEHDISCRLKFDLHVLSKKVGLSEHKTKEYLDFLVEIGLLTSVKNHYFNEKIKERADQYMARKLRALDKKVRT